MLSGKTIIVGVCGGIAAYKTAELVSRLKQANADVWIVMTDSGQKFVTPLTFRTLSGNPITINLFAEELSSMPVPHISLTDKADLVVIAPVTANMIGKIARGIADDALSTMVMSAKCKKLLAPAMNNNMWENPVVQENVEKLKKLKFEFIGPETGHLACGSEGIGRMSPPEVIFEKITTFLCPTQDLKGKNLLITAGGTQEDIDPVRYISNRSSGKMGYALAEAAAARGAKVTLISANVTLPAPRGTKLVKVNSARQMLSAVKSYFDKADTVIMAAAVADYKSEILNPKSETNNKSKIKKSNNKLMLELSPTEDILKLVTRDRRRAAKKIVGFALETENMLENAKEKLKEKDLDLIIANGPENFGSDLASATLISASGKTKSLRQLPKKELAHRILDATLDPVPKRKRMVQG